VAYLGENVSDTIALRFLGRGEELCRVRVVFPRTDERDMVPQIGESVDESRADGLDAAVARRRHRKPGRCDDGDP
jgi:hypothetical protein